MWFGEGYVCIGGAGASTCFPWQAFLIHVGSAALMLGLVLGVLAWDARRIPTPSQAAQRANRHATLASLVGVAMLVVVLMWLAVGFLFGARPSDGRVVALLPALAGACLLVAQAVGQLTWPRPTGSHREADLLRRDVAAVTPRWPRRLVLLWAGGALLLLAVLGVVADGPRSLTRVAGSHTEVIGPYPGWYYGVPMGLAIIAILVATQLVLRLINERPAVAGVSAEWDLHLRRRSAAHVTRGVQLVLAITLAGILVAAGLGHLARGRRSVSLALQRYAAEGSSAQDYLGSALLIAALCVLLLALAGTVLPLRRGQRKNAMALGVTATS